MLLRIPLVNKSGIHPELLFIPVLLHHKLAKRSDTNQIESQDVKNPQVTYSIAFVSLIEFLFLTSRVFCVWKVKLCALFTVIDLGWWLLSGLCNNMKITQQTDTELKREPLEAGGKGWSRWRVSFLAELLCPGAAGELTQKSQSERGRDTGNKIKKNKLGPVQSNFKVKQWKSATKTAPWKTCSNVVEEAAWSWNLFFCFCLFLAKRSND